jgi:hypothetical protein
LKRARDTECQLLEIAHAAYAKLQKAEARDPEVREINKSLRRVLGGRQEEAIKAHERKAASRSRSKSKKR